MKTSKEARTKARQLFGACLVDGVVYEDRVRTVIARLRDLKPRGYLPILAQFGELVRLNLEENSTVVESVQPLDDHARGQLEHTLRARHGQHLSFEYRQNPDLIGGTRIRVGSRVYDSSVRARLDRLATSFAR